MAIEQSTIFDFESRFRAKGPFDDWLTKRRRHWQQDAERREGMRGHRHRGRASEEHTLADDYRSYVHVTSGENGSTEVTLYLHVVVVTTSPQGTPMPQRTRDYWDRVPEAFEGMRMNDLNASVTFHITIHQVEELTEDAQKKVDDGGALVAYYDPENTTFRAAVYNVRKREVRFKHEYPFLVRGVQDVQHFNLASEVEHHLGYRDQYFYDKQNDEYVIANDYINTLQGTANVKMQPIEIRKLLEWAAQSRYIQRRIRKDGFFETENGYVNVVMEELPQGAFEASTLKPAPPVAYPVYEADKTAFYRLQSFSFGTGDKADTTPVVRKLKR